LSVFRVKICGITTAGDARLACQAGADAVGLNFFSGSSRFVTRELAKEIAAAISPGVLIVGVFVNASAEEILLTASEVPLDVIQLHGDEPPAFLAELPGVRILKAFRCAAAELPPWVEYLAECEKLGRKPEAILIDAAAPGQYGGSGQTIDWSMLPQVRAQLAGLAVILAGGLNPENVSEAIRVARPEGVDVASGVEKSPGVKDSQRVIRFVARACGR
jgi:phosphoribosylanthranilate isomerase